MNTQAVESLFGPPSEIIDVAQFILAAADANSKPMSSEDDPRSNEASGRENAAEQYSVVDLRESLSDIWNNPILSAHLLKSHDHTVASLFATRNSKSKRKVNVPEINSRAEEAANLQKGLDAIKLSSWKLRADSALFMRSSKNSDYNTLEHVKLSSDLPPFSDLFQAIITLTIFNKLTWSPGYVVRSSQHALLSLQTLGDLFETIPCISKELATATDLGYNHEATRHEITRMGSGCVFCIEGVAYGDGLDKEDYADKLIKYLATISKGSPFMTKASTSIYDTPFSSLKLRINQPYWLLHQGNCEHFIVIDQIRLQHPSDVLSGYPLTLQITPPLLDLCRACTKVPAVLSIIGDVRLGESPYLMCRSCWKVMGDSPDPDVIVIPLPTYNLGG